MGSADRGFTTLELLLAMIILGILVVLMMPSMSGAYTNRQLLQYAELAAGQMQTVEHESFAQGTKLQWHVHGGFGGNWTTSQGTVTVPPQFDLQGCYLDNFNPNMTWNNGGMCNIPAAWNGSQLIVVCIDNDQGFAYEVLLGPGEQVNITSVNSNCPAI